MIWGLIIRFSLETCIDCMYAAAIEFKYFFEENHKEDRKIHIISLGFAIAMLLSILAVFVMNFT